MINTEVTNEALNSSQEEYLSEVDKMSLELSQTRRQLALSQGELADLSYRYTILQLYMKYKLTEFDTINEGKIIRGALNK